MDIKINVNNQVLTRTDNNTYLVADTRNYVHAIFELSSEWDALDATVIFKTTNELGRFNTEVPLNDADIIIPDIVLKAGTFAITLMGTDLEKDILLTTNEIVIKVDPSGYVEDGEEIETYRTEEEDPAWQEILSSLE